MGRFTLGLEDSVLRANDDATSFPTLAVPSSTTNRATADAVIPAIETGSAVLTRKYEP